MSLKIFFKKVNFSIRSIPKTTIYAIIASKTDSINAPYQPAAKSL